MRSDFLVPEFYEQIKNQLILASLVGMGTSFFIKEKNNTRTPLLSVLCRPITTSTKPVRCSGPIERLSISLCTRQLKAPKRHSQEVNRKCTRYEIRRAGFGSKIYRAGIKSREAPGGCS